MNAVENKSSMRLNAMEHERSFCIDTVEHESSMFCVHVNASYMVPSEINNAVVFNRRKRLELQT